MRFSKRARERSLLTGHHHKASVMTHQTPGNQARVSKPIEITDRVILVCHERGIKHPSGARLAARRDAESLERLER
jgi:hypothetical protein